VVRAPVQSIASQNQGWPVDCGLRVISGSLRLRLPFHRARISGGSRREMEVRTSADFGRPRGRSNLFAMALPKSSGRTSRAGRARRKSASVQGGLSGSVCARFRARFFFISPFPAPVRFAQADCMNHAIARGKDQHVKPRANVTKRPISAFAIVTANVLGYGRCMSIKLHGTLHRDAVPHDVAGIFFGRIERDVHIFIVYAINACRKAAYLAATYRLRVVPTPAAPTPAGCFPRAHPQSHSSRWSGR